MPPAAKRVRSGAGASSQAPTAAECAKMVKRLSKETAQDLLAQLMASSPEARAAVQAEVAVCEPVDLRAYSSKASDIISSLDGLRASKQFELCGDVQDRLVDLIEECKERLSSTDAFAALVTIIDVVQSEAEGEVRKGVLGCGGIDVQIAEELESLAEDMSSEEKESISDAVDDLEGVVEAMEPYCIGDGLKDVVSQIRGN